MALGVPITSVSDVAVNFTYASSRLANGLLEETCDEKDTDTEMFVILMMIQHVP